MSFCVKDILRMQVAPALGCTEPVALAAAAARAVFPGRSERVDLWVDPNMYKNGLAVIIPGKGGLSGLDLAGALGVFGGDASLGLEVLEPLDEESVQAARSLVCDECHGHRRNHRRFVRTDHAEHRHAQHRRHD